MPEFSFLGDIPSILQNTVVYISVIITALFYVLQFTKTYYSKNAIELS